RSRAEHQVQTASRKSVFSRQVERTCFSVRSSNDQMLENFTPSTQAPLKMAPSRFEKAKLVPGMKMTPEKSAFFQSCPSSFRTRSSRPFASHVLAARSRTFPPSFFRRLFQPSTSPSE